MSEDADRIKRLIAFRKRIETRIGDLETELKELQATLETVNSILMEKGFKRAEISTKAPKPKLRVRKKERRLQWRRGRSD